MEATLILAADAAVGKQKALMPAMAGIATVDAARASAVAPVALLPNGPSRESLPSNKPMHLF